VLIKRPMPAIVRLLQNIVIVIPIAFVSIHMTIRSFLPTRSPTKTKIKNPTTPPTYIMVYMKSSCIFYESQRKSPNLFASEYIDFAGM